MQYRIRPVVWGDSRHSGLALPAIKTCGMISFPRRDGRSWHLREVRPPLPLTAIAVPVVPATQHERYLPVTTERPERRMVERSGGGVREGSDQISHGQDL